MTREFGRAADPLARVLKCAKDAALPVDTSTDYELIDRLAALVPTPRTHCHRYYGVLSRSKLAGDRSFDDLDNFITQDELHALSDDYKRVAGFAPRARDF